jgi:hypothetical protein
LEIFDGFVIIKIRLNESLRTFRILENKNAMRLFFDYMDFQVSLEGAAVRLELMEYPSIQLQRDSIGLMIFYFGLGLM